MTQGALTLQSTYSIPASGNPYGVCTYGNNVYVCQFYGSSASGILQLASDPNTGALSQIGANPLLVSTTSNPRRARVAPDGKNLYVAVTGYGDLYTFTRSAADGSLSGSIRQAQAGTPVNSTLYFPTDVDISPDNAHVYLAENNQNGSNGAIIVYSRAANGALTAIQRFALVGAFAVRCSPDGSAVYVANQSDNTLKWYSRDNNPQSGTYGQILSLIASIATPAGAPSAVDVTDDNNFIYVSCDSSGYYTGCFQRNTSNNTLTAISPPAQTSDNNGGPWWVVVSRDSGNNSVYVAQSDKQLVTQYTRNNGTGALTAMAPGSVGTSYYTSGSMHGSGGPDGLCVRSDNKFLFATNNTPNTIDVFSIDQGGAPAVSSVSISPTTATVTGGMTKQFTASAVASGGASTALTWTTDAPAGGSVSSTGLFTAPPGTAAVQTVHVTATSSFDNTKSATATVTVPAKIASSETVQLVDANGNPLANLTGLKWAFFDQVTPGSFAAPTAKGSAGTTDASGNFTANITGTALITGSTGWLTVSDSDGTTTQSPGGRVFSGPVAVV